MKNKIMVFVIAILSSSCTNSSTENAKETTPSAVEGRSTPAPPNVKGVVKQIAGRYYIPTDNIKSNFILTINQNLTLRLVNYNGHYEGKAVDDVIQFDDKNGTKIQFSLKDSILLLKNENDVTLEFREAEDRDLIIGQWRKSTGAFESFSGDGIYQSTYAGTGRYKRNVDNKFTASGLSYDVTCQFRLNGPDQLSGNSSFNSNDKWSSIKVKEKKLESLNRMFD